MKKSILLTLLISLITLPLSAQWREDILGANYQQQSISLGTDYDGEVITTVVRRTPLEGVKRAILYVHGYNDYFFQDEMATRFADSTWQFYAVDLRKYGRSLREGDTRFRVYDIEEYFADIDATIEVMLADGIDEIVMMGHSTGGLTTSLYCDARGAGEASSPIKALILNSPFFDMNLSWSLENIVQPVITILGKYFKEMVVQGASDELSLYAKSLLKEYNGEWSFDTDLKISYSDPTTAGWLRAICLAQNELQSGLDIKCPVLVLYSDKSVYGEWSDDYMRGDSVLDVADIEKYADTIGPNVTEVVIPEALHDVVLSNKTARERAFTAMFDFLLNCEL